MLGWLKRIIDGSDEKAFRAALTDQVPALDVATIMERVEQRFGGRVYFFQEEEIDLSRKSASASNDVWTTWADILNKYPYEARTQSEVKANEERFWRVYSTHYTITDHAGRPDLARHADIIEFYKNNESWILRAYFAATGIVIDPSVKEENRVLFALEKTNGLYWSERSRIQAGNDSERLTRELEQYRAHGKKAHFEKWGKWFVAHVEEQFKRDNKPAQPLPEDVHGSGGFASAEDINRMRQQGRGSAAPAAHQQSFRD